ncbi:ubiquitin-protein transferase activating protein, partial [Bonamia ostreae]
VGRFEAIVEIYNFSNYFLEPKKDKISRDLKFSQDYKVLQTHGFRLQNSSGRVGALCWSKRRKILFCASAENQIFAFKFSGRSPRLVALLSGPKAGACRLRWSPLGSSLAIGGRDGNVYLFKESDIVASAKSATHREHEKIDRKELKFGQKAVVKEVVMAVEWCPWKSNLLAVGTASGKLQLFDLRQKSKRLEKSAEVQSGRGAVTGIVFLPQHREMLSSHGCVKDKNR